jgi:hypothetical protein
LLAATINTNNPTLLQRNVKNQNPGHKLQSLPQTFKAIILFSIYTKRSQCITTLLHRRRRYRASRQRGAPQVDDVPEDRAIPVELIELMTKISPCTPKTKNRMVNEGMDADF